MANSPDCMAAIYAIALAGAVVGADQHPLPRGRAALRDHQRRAGGDHHQRPDRRLRRPARPDRERAARTRDPPRDPYRLASRPRRRCGRSSRSGPAGPGHASTRPELLERAARRERRRARSPARRRAGRRHRAVLYTSGTTAQPRGCVLTHEALVRCWTNVGRVYSAHPEDRCWAPCPLFHLARNRAADDVRRARRRVHLGHVLRADGGARSDRARARDGPVPAYPPITQAVLDAPGFAAADADRRRARC